MTKTGVKRGRGRPPGSRYGCKTEIHVYLTTEEKQSVQDAARSQGKSDNDFVREALFKLLGVKN